MNNKLWYGLAGIAGLLGGLLAAEKRKSKELEEILEERGKQFEENSKLIDETISLYKEATETQGEVIKRQEEIIEKLDPELGKKIKSLNFKDLKNEARAE